MSQIHDSTFRHSPPHRRLRKMSTSSRFGMLSKKQAKTTVKYHLSYLTLSILKARKSHVVKSLIIAIGALQGVIAGSVAHTWVAQCLTRKTSLQTTLHLINVAVLSNLAKSDLVKTTHCRLADFQVLNYLASLNYVIINCG